MEKVEMEIEENEIVDVLYQKENFYNKLLPYADKLEEESSKLFLDIKTNLIKSVLAKEMRPGCALWTTRLKKYMKIYGLKFSKQDHIYLIQLYYQLITIPNLEPTRINKFALILQHLLKKRHLLSQDDLQLEWRPLYNLCLKVTEKSRSGTGMYRYFLTLESSVKAVVRCCRMYFPAESTQEILDEFKPKLCPHSSEDIEYAISYLEIFLPVVMKPEQAEIGYKLWLEELMNLWEVCHNASSWENYLLWLMARVANFNIGFINWENHIPIMYVRFLRALQLPIYFRKKQTAKSFKIDISGMSVWIVATLGGGSDTAFFHLEKFMQTLESYFHSANIGKWTVKIREILKTLAFYFVERVNIERYRKPSWDLNRPENFKLTDADIDRFVEIMKPCINQAMFSRSGTNDVIQALQYLAALRPNIIVPIVLEKLYASMDSLTEPHKLTSSISCAMGVSRFMVSGPKNNYPEGPTHVVPLLFSILPGIDPNDFHKCFITFDLICHLANLAPFVDCSEANNYYDDLTDDEHIICEASAGFEDFMIQLFDRIFIWVESNSLDFVRMEQNDLDQKSKLETISEHALYNLTTSILYQCSTKIFMTVLRKLHNFVMNRILESKVSGKLVAVLCSCFSKVNPKETLKLFVPELCEIIEKLLNENEHVASEEHLTDELTYYLLILSEIIDGNASVLPYIDRLINVLDRILHMKSVQSNKLSAHMLVTLMISLTTIQPIEFRSVTKSFDTHVKDYLIIRDWGKPGNLKQLNIKWYVPGDSEIECVQMLFNKYLIPELETLNEFAIGKRNLKKNELIQSLRIVYAITGCQSVLPQWEEPALNLMDSLIPPWSFEMIVGTNHTIKMPDGRNVRKVIADCIHFVQKRILEVDEGNTTSLHFIIKIYSALLLNKNIGKDFDIHWKTFHVTKKLLEDKLHQKKARLRYILVDRIKLHQEFRTESRSCTFTETHKQILMDLFELGISRYSEVRKSAQGRIFSATNLFPYSYTVLTPSIKHVLQLDTVENPEKFKGCLNILMGSKTNTISTKNDWAFIKDVWLCIVNSKPCEKPSVINLITNFSDTIKLFFPTIAIKTDFTDECLKIAKKMSNNVPIVDLRDAESLMIRGEEQLMRNNQERVKTYNEFIHSLLHACLYGNLHWRHYTIAVEFIKILVHPDVKYSKEVINFFLHALLHEQISIRKIASKVVQYILMQNKPKFIKKSYSLDHFGITSRQVIPGIRKDNLWLLYNSKTVPNSSEEWDKMRYVHKQYIGFYTWPKQLELYAPSHEQPTQSKRMNNLTVEEKEIFNFFSNENNAKELIRYFSMEEKKGKDQYNIWRMVIFKNLFKMYEDKLLDVYLPHLQILVEDVQEQSQRCATEIITGIIRGSKHWSYESTVKLWTELIPMIRVALFNISVETAIDWNKGVALSLESRDPNRSHWLLEFLIDNPLSEQTSFSNCVRLNLIQNALHQQPWRNAELIHRVLDYFKSYLSHPFQNVREKISYCLIGVFAKDIVFPEGNNSECPRVKDFFEQIMPTLRTLYINILSELDAAEKDKNISSINTPVKNLTKDEKEEMIRMFKTISKFVTGSIAKTNCSAVPEHYQLLPLACILQGNEIDDELSSLCSDLLAVMSHSLILHRYVPAALAAIEEVSECPLWSARAAITEYIPVFIFHNMFTIVTKREWVTKLIEINLKLLKDSQPEVRMLAAKLLSGLLHYHFIPEPMELLTEFKKKSKASMKAKATKKQLADIRMKHYIVLGLCAFINAHPYDVPDYLPDVFQHLGLHLNDPEPVPSTIRRTLGDFKRTHHDNWEVHKLRFTEEELIVLSDLTVPPSYYA